ncbi:RAB6-interacting golgin [Aricia agestis]|uniref:RAB6-interacting golgin n=1 Tax=Aricia agestis TaxID=91739 RepID=UPI001C20B481|nr:RAB6-interacting golgin [Aricia agestis]
MNTFTGFSEEDLRRLKTSEAELNNVSLDNSQNVRKIDKLGFKRKKTKPSSLSLDADETFDSTFDKCKLSLKTPTPIKELSPKENMVSLGENENSLKEKDDYHKENKILPKENKEDTLAENKEDSRRSSTNVTPDVIRCVDNYTEDELETHKAKLEDLQLRQKLMEEQNKKRKEMLAKALADRTKQTEEEVMKLEKIKKELEVLDGQLSKDVAMLRKKIDAACIQYSEAEKQYLKVEKEFLQAKINLQKEKEKKELLIEHLCTLITHNETRKAEKLETLMLELASSKIDVHSSNTSLDESPIIIDGVDEKTGKFVALPDS